MGAADDAQDGTWQGFVRESAQLLQESGPLRAGNQGGRGVSRVAGEAIEANGSV